MQVSITIIHPDLTRTEYASVNDMPASEIKTEIQTLLANQNLRVKHITKRVIV